MNMELNDKVTNFDYQTHQEKATRDDNSLTWVTKLLEPFPRGHRFNSQAYFYSHLHSLNWVFCLTSPHANLAPGHYYTSPLAHNQLCFLTGILSLKSLKEDSLDSAPLGFDVQSLLTGPAQLCEEIAAPTHPVL